MEFIYHGLSQFNSTQPTFEKKNQVAKKEDLHPRTTWTPSSLLPSREFEVIITSYLSKHRHLRSLSVSGFSNGIDRRRVNVRYDRVDSGMVTNETASV